MQGFVCSQHSWPSLKLTFPFLLYLYDVQSTLDFKSSSRNKLFKQAEKTHHKRGKELNPDPYQLD